ncbi:MAG: hypoxanthine phosphoribosyltransferase [marine bacterium B5-7]|nr:MAG: hypoxanthine phosphoribosyltransferase [marine bacterium B5-7]
MLPANFPDAPINQRIVDTFENPQILYDADTVRGFVQRMADYITSTFDGNFVLMGVMNGALQLQADVLRALYGVDGVLTETIRVASYEGTTRGELSIVSKPASENIKDKTIVVVDDVNDSGTTLKAIQDYLYGEGAKEVHSIVLFEKPCAKYPANFVAEPLIDNDFIVGYCLDCHGLFRNLDYVFKVDGLR